MANESQNSISKPPDNNEVEKRPSDRQLAKQYCVSPSYFSEFCRVLDAAKVAGKYDSFETAMWSGTITLSKWVSENFPEYAAQKQEAQRRATLKSVIKKLVSEHKWTIDQIVIVVLSTLNDVGALPHADDCEVAS